MDTIITFLIANYLDNNDMNLQVILHTIEEDRPKSYFYRLLLLGVQEDAAAMENAIWSAFKKDNLMEYMKRNLVGYISGT